MSSRGSWPVAITAAPGSVGATVVTRMGGQVRVTAIVKATFALVKDQPMTPAAPDPIAIGDEHEGKNPSRGVAVASDLAPYLPRADVLLRGHACAFGGAPMASFTVRLIVARDEGVLLNKRLTAQGSRDRAGNLVPFAKMPLLWELAAGGPQSPDNPVGVAVRGKDEPNIVDPRDKARPVGFGPIARKWPARRKLLGAMDPGRLDAPIPELPDGFPWAYFNAAPEDQRTEFLRGNEWIVLEGTSPDVERLQSSLPGLRGAAKVYGPNAPAGRPIQLVADTLSIDADKQRCSIVFRGAFPVGGEGELADLHVFAGVESAGRPIAFPATYTPPPRPSPADQGPASVKAPPQSVAQPPSQGPKAPPQGVAQPPSQGAKAPPSRGAAMRLAPENVAPSQVAPPQARQGRPVDVPDPFAAARRPAGPQAPKGVFDVTIAPVPDASSARSTPFQKPAAGAPQDIFEIARRAAAATPRPPGTDLNATIAPSPAAAIMPATPFRGAAGATPFQTLPVDDATMPLAPSPLRGMPFQTLPADDATMLPAPSPIRAPVTPFRPAKPGAPPPAAAISKGAGGEDIFEIARRQAAQEIGEATEAPAPAVAQRAATPFERAAVPADKHSATPFNKPSATPFDKHSATPFDKHSGTPFNKPSATPFDKPSATPVAPAAPAKSPAAAPPAAPRRERAAAQTMALSAFDIDKLQHTPAVPFAGGAAPTPATAPMAPIGPLPAATPFDRAPVSTGAPVPFHDAAASPAPRAPAAPVMQPAPVPEVPELGYMPRDVAASRVAEELARAAPIVRSTPPPPMPLGAVPTVPAEPEATPTTLGAHFLAAMARSGRTARPSA